MKNTIEFLSYKRAKIGWNHCHKLIDHLGRIESKLPFIFSFETNELLIVDDVLIEYLDFLAIPYTLIKPSQAIRYIKEED